LSCEATARLLREKAAIPVGQVSSTTPQVDIEWTSFGNDERLSTSGKSNCGHLTSKERSACLCVGTQCDASC